MVTRMSALFIATILCFATLQSFSATEETVPSQNTSTEITISRTRQYSYDFGSWPIHRLTYHDFYLSNRGESTYVSQVTTFGSGFSSESNCPRRLQRGSSCVVRVYFRPWNEGFHTGQTIIMTSSGNTYVNLTGWGY